jgi:asparagine synthase (glutamine-hydrolysing)
VKQLYGYLPFGELPSAPAVLAGMLESGRDYESQNASIEVVDTLNIGTLSAPAISDATAGKSSVSLEGRFHVWMAGEVFDAGNLFTAKGGDVYQSVDLLAVLTAYLSGGSRALHDLDGEYQLVIWDTVERTLVLLNDRFGSLPLYWARSAVGFAFGSSVRSVLMAPGISAVPDHESLRQATTFGGFRLGDRTTVNAVKMLRGAGVLTVREGRVTVERSWSWSEIPATPTGTIDDLIDEAHRLWRRAIDRRLVRSERPGLHLSGGLDSRAILAEASRHHRLTAITYGIAGCDDEHYARLAAAEAGADWRFHSYYSDDPPDWLERRTSYVLTTDGMVDLTDLGHLETLPLQVSAMDLHLSGYIGDAVAGPTFNDVTDAGAVVAALPYYGGTLGMPYDRAIELGEEMVRSLDGAAARFALFEHKLPQSTNRWCAAWRHWIPVRRPFTDYAFFEFFQGLPRESRGKERLYEKMLRARYPRFFARIPNQKTGLPILSPRWRVQAERARRFAWRSLQPSLLRVTSRARARIRSYTDDASAWSEPACRKRITDTILRDGSIACEVFGRQPVQSVVDDYFERQAAPTQVIGSLYSFESYHSSVDAHLAAARRRAEELLARSSITPHSVIA